MKIEASFIIGAIKQGIEDLVKQSYILRSQDEKPESYNQRISALQILKDSFSSVPGALSQGDLVAFYIDCEMKLRETLAKNFYPISMAEPMTKNIRDNIALIIGIETWNAYYNPKVKECVGC